MTGLETGWESTNHESNQHRLLIAWQMKYLEKFIRLNMRR